jgi:hypothetical protein
MREPEEPPHGSADENPEPRRPPDTSWGVGPWPVQSPPRERRRPTHLTALCHRSLRAIILRPCAQP